VLYTLTLPCPMTSYDVVRFQLHMSLPAMSFGDRFCMSQCSVQGPLNSYTRLAFTLSLD